MGASSQTTPAEAVVSCTFLEIVFLSTMMMKKYFLLTKAWNIFLKRQPLTIEKSSKKLSQTRVINPASFLFLYLSKSQQDGGDCR